MINNDLHILIKKLEYILRKDDRFFENDDYLYKKNIKKITKVKKTDTIDLTALVNTVQNNAKKKSNFHYISLLSNDKKEPEKVIETNDNNYCDIYLKELQDINKKMSNSLHELTDIIKIN